MPKSKKKKRQDFQKVKLKVGKKLPKGDNVTNLSFKTRQIQLTQRIKDDDGQDLVTKKKLSIQDLLRQCDHHSSTARVNAVAGLKELWLNNSEELLVPTNPLGYGEILKKLSSLLIDNEAIVRHSSINLFKLMLTRLAPKSVEDKFVDHLGGSLYTHIHAYLCCAMNHVHEDIKLDALVLFDTLVDSFPHLLVQQTGDLLKNLVGLISSPAYLGAKGDSTTQRLSLNPDSKLPAMKFRARVLQRMKRTFMEALDDQTRHDTSSESTAESLKNRTWSLFADHKGPNTKQNTTLVTDAAVRRFSVMFLGGSHELDDYITKPSSLESFLKLSIPVLLQCWKEARASVDEQSSSDNLVAADTVEVMSLVTCIIQLMFILCSMHQRKASHARSSEICIVPPELLVKNYQQDFKKLFMNDFPYSVQVQAQITKKKKKSKSTTTAESAASQTSLVSLNLAVCDIMSSFCAAQTFTPDKECLKKVANHVVHTLQKSPNADQSKILIRVLKNVFSSPQAAGEFTQGYSAAFQFYMSCSTKMPQKELFYNLFAYMTQSWNGWERHGNEPQPIYRYGNNTDVKTVLEGFCHQLPDLLLGVVRSERDREWSVNILTLMAHGHVQNCSQTFHDSFKTKLTEILDPETGVLACDDEHVQRRLCCLLSLGKPLSRDHLKMLLYVMRQPAEKPVLHRRKSCSVVSYAIYSIISGIRKHVPLTSQAEFNQMTPDQHTHLSDYLRFMFSLQIGMTGEELDVFSPTESADRRGDRGLSVDFTVQGDQWDRHVEIANIVARELVSFHIPAHPSKGYHQIFTFVGNVEQLWKHACTNRQKVHILSAYSLIQFFHQASLQPTEKPSTDFYSLASQIIAAVLAGLFCQSTIGLAPSEQMVWQIKSDVIQCLTADSSLCDLVMAVLAERSKEREEGQACGLAQDFLLSDENLKQRVRAQREKDGATCLPMDVS